jgi:FAD/FMN-containing dehydrogenase
MNDLAPADLQSALDQIQALLRDRLSTALAVREQHGKDQTYHQGAPPDAVAFAHSTDEVSQIVRICATHRVPVIAYGTGTSLEGHIAALKGGVTLDLSEMNQVLEVNAEDLDCRPGSRATSSTRTCATPACSSRSTPAPMPASAAWRRRAPRAPTRCATARCATTCSACARSWPTAR